MQFYSINRFSLLKLLLACYTLSWQVKKLIKNFPHCWCYLLSSYCIQGSRARALYKAGMRTPQAIAESPIPEIVKALFESSAWAAEGNIFPCIEWIMFWLYFMPLSMDPLSAFCFLPYFVKHLLYFILRYFIQGKVHRCCFGAKQIYLFVITLINLLHVYILMICLSSKICWC